MMAGAATTRRVRPVVARMMAIICVGALAACAGRPATLPAAQANVPGSAHEDASYVIGPGDQLNVFVYDNPQLSMSVPVRPDGRISIPLVPDIVAAGQTPAALSKTLTDRLAKYVQDPNVTVIMQGFVGPFDRQIRVIGEAADPQALTYRDHMSVLDVMIAVKGLTRFAAGNRAVIVRQTPNGSRSELKVHLSDLIKDGDITQNVEMQPGDTLIIPQTWF